MKRYQELTNRELAVLSDEQVADLIDLECAVNGVRLLPPKPIKPEAPNLLQHDVEAYEVLGLLFKDRSQALGLLDFVGKQEIFRSEYTSKAIEPVRPGDYAYPRMEVRALYSPEKAKDVENEKRTYEKALDEYNTALMEYHEIDDARYKYYEEVWGAVRTAENTINAENKLYREFDKYVSLASGDTQLAYKFLSTVYVVEPYDVFIAEHAKWSAEYTF